MANITVTGEEYGNIVIAFLLDAIINPEVLEGNEEFRSVIEKMESKGMKPILLREFLNMSAAQRIQYKRIKPSFVGKPGRNSILIQNGKEEIQENLDNLLTKEQVRETVQKVIALLKKRRRDTRLPVSRKNTEKIIEHVLSQEKYLIESEEQDG